MIGANWVEILAKKGEAGDDDSVVMEIRTAIRKDKEIVPVLVDTVPMLDSRTSLKTFSRFAS